MRDTRNPSFVRDSARYTTDAAVVVNHAPQGFFTRRTPPGGTDRGLSLAEPLTLMSARDTDATFQPVAAAMAAALPGLGYLWYADIKRAVYVAIGVLGLFAFGLFVAGIDAVDRAEDKWWFLLQAGVGPTAFVVDHIHQTQFKTSTAGSRRVTPPPPAAGGGNQANKSVGRVNESGMLMAALAGMLNLIAIIDCAWHAPVSKRRRGADEPVTLRVGTTAPAAGTGGATR